MKPRSVGPPFGRVTGPLWGHPPPEWRRRNERSGGLKRSFSRAARAAQDGQLSSGLGRKDRFAAQYHVFASRIQTKLLRYRFRSSETRKVYTRTPEICSDGSTCINDCNDKITAVHSSDHYATIITFPVAGKRSKTTSTHFRPI